MLNIVGVQTVLMIGNSNTRVIW